MSNDLEICLIFYWYFFHSGMKIQKGGWVVEMIDDGDRKLDGLDY